MSKGWKEIARLGGTGAQYPHVLADKLGWCLRFGRKRGADDLRYSSLPVLLRGLVEHSVRRRLMSLSGVLEIKELCREVEDALGSALGMCHEALVRGGLEAHSRRLQAPGAPGMAPVSASQLRRFFRAARPLRGSLNRRRAV